MKVLITGGTGFIGSHLAEELVSAGYNVLLYDISPGNMKELMEISLIQRHDWVHGDVVNYGLMMSVLKGFKPDQIVHLAGISHTVASALGQSAALRPGVMGLATIQDAVRRCLENGDLEAPPRILIASSSLTSGQFNCFPVEATPESAVPLGTAGSWSPWLRSDLVDSDASLLDLKDCYHQYVDNKLAMEMLCFSNYAQHRLPFTIMRFGTQYGPRMNRNVVTWYFIRNALLGKPLEVHGDGRQARQHFYVKDLVKGILLILENPDITEGKIISLVPPNMTSVRELANAVAAVVPEPVQIEHVGKRPIDVRVRRISPSPELVELGWKITWPLRDGLAETVEYYRNRMDLVREGFDERIKEEN